MTTLRNRALRVEILESRELMAGDTYLVNFQNDEGTTPARYLRDSGLVFGVHQGGFEYGWSTSQVANSRERSAEPDQRLDTLIQMGAGVSWEFALANGTYSVTVAVGDPLDNLGVHTINVEGVNYWNATPDGNGALVKTMTVTVADGRLTINNGAAANLATRINYVQIVGLPSSPNSGPAAPTITEPSTEGQEASPADVHMEAIGYIDPESNTHKSTDWEIWTVGANPEPVWQTLGIEGVERLHTHFGDGIFINGRASEISLAENTPYQLRIRFRDDTGAVSSYAVRNFVTGSASEIFPLQLTDIATTPAVSWVDAGNTPIELDDGSGILSPLDAIIAIDLDGGSDDPANEAVTNAIDGTSAKYLNFGEVNSGFIVTPASGASLVTGFRITTANDADERDPSGWALYGTNSAIASTNHSTGNAEPWTLIGTGALTLPAGRNTAGAIVSVTNAVSYTSYRMVFTGVRNAGAANSMQIGEIQFYGESGVPAAGQLLAPGDFIRAIDLDGDSESPPGEGVANAIDGTNAKYLNRGESNSGFIVTPSSGASTLTGFRMTTANDAQDRDPRGWAIYGTNDVISSANHSTGSAENWVLIASGTNMNLPNQRNTLGSLITFANTTEYSSYRMVVTSVRNGGAAQDMQFAEVQFFGEFGNQGGGEVVPPSMTLEDGATGADLLVITGSELAGNAITNPAPLAGDGNLRIVVAAGSRALNLPLSNLTFTDNLGFEREIFLPAIDLAAGQSLYLWVSNAGGTYYGAVGQTVPNFTSVARDANLIIPYVVTRPGFVIELVGEDYRLPVNIAFVPNPGPNPTDPLYFVTELYGSIQVVTRDGTRHEFATGLLDYNPQGPISGSGEQGLTGIAVRRNPTNPEIYELYVGMLADNGAPAGNGVHYPKVERLTSAAGGLTLASRTVLLNMQPETQGQSHQISNVTIGPDNLLYVHVGDGFNAGTAQNLDQYRGKILRMNFDGTPVTTNPFYDASNGINSRDYIFAYGFRNPFGGAWRASDGHHYEVENGPSVDRLAQVNMGVNYGWNGSDASMAINAIYNWAPATAPTNLTFIQRETFAGSMFPASMMDHLFVAESGPTYATGPQGNGGKRITEFVLSATGNGALIDGPDALIQYVGTGQGTVVGLAAGPDGLYFTTLYEDTGAGGATGPGAQIYRVRYVNPLSGDYDIDGDIDRDDYTVWRNTFGSNLLLAADGNHDGVVDSADYTIWRDNFLAMQAALAATPVTETASVTVSAAASTPSSTGTTTSNSNRPASPTNALQPSVLYAGPSVISRPTRSLLETVVAARASQQAAFDGWLETNSRTATTMSETIDTLASSQKQAATKATAFDEPFASALRVRWAK